ncbi:MAG: anhydro-N-acetylmuramic acid kinase [Cellvibrio sp. 79]|nr:MAG: anhydro-N-acetylmuramic acid kinase [Cellvibrio sp. 79]
MSKRQLYIGLMSGTSADGIDAALVDMQTTPKLLATHTLPFSGQLRQKIHSISLPGTNEIDRMGALDVELGKHFAECSIALIAKAGITTDDVIAIGSHGQTIRHRPPGSQEGCFTVQIGDPNTIAELTGITTVADFRRRDMAAGGQGAPLVPAFHRAIFHSQTKDRVIVNIGGMANITWLPSIGDVCGFDTGPGNVLLDLWVHEHQSKCFDADGQWAASGHVIPDLLELFLHEPFFSKPHPKSTGRESFNRAWLDNHLHMLKHKYAASDVQASLLELTAVSISDSIKRLSNASKEVLICGGGAFNKRLMQRLSELLPDCDLATTAKASVDPQWIEAMAFAWLAQQTINHRPGNLCAVTGAKREVILGGVYFAS